MDKKLGDYLILDKIAHGGMAEVYKAKTLDPLGIERLVVIKRILPHIASQPEYIEMLVDEAKIAVHFSHGNIAQIYDLGRIGDDYFIVMEFVDGKTLSQVLRAFRDKPTPIPIDIAVYAVLEVCRALDYIHNKADASGAPLGIVHRDISPQNIIISYSGNVKVIDFGVAKSLEKLNQTEAGVLKGKFAYMSPEQARGDFVNHRSDLFSVGILLWELLTQTRLFKRPNNKATVQAVLKYKAPKVTDIRGEVPKSLERIVQKTLRKHRWRRYKQASDIAHDLENFLHEFYPDFRPLHVTEFLYQYFGPESDESHLPLEIKLPPKEAEPTKRSPLQASINTSKEGNLTSRGMKKAKKWLAGILLSLLMLLLGLIIFSNSPKARLFIEVKPGTAFISINEKSIERIPEGLYVLDVDADDEIDLEVKQSGYLDFETAFTLLAGETKKLAINLEAIIPKRNLTLESIPTGADIFIDDKPLNQQTPFELKELKEGSRVKLGLFLTNYAYEEKILEITKSLKDPLSVSLKPLPPQLELNSIPPGANIYLNGQLMGVAPYSIQGLSVGNTYILDVGLEGYAPQRLSIEFKPGEKKVLSISLEKL